MRRFPIIVLLLSSVCAFAAEQKPTLPSWFPKPDGLYEVGNLKYYAYKDFDLTVDTTTLPRNSGGYALIAGRVWTFRIDNPKANAWTAAANALLKQGFHFVHGDMKSVAASSTLQKGSDPATATYVSFWQCCNAAAIVEPGPNPFHVTARPPAATPEKFGEKSDVPYLPPIAGSKLVAGNNDKAGSWIQPSCDKSEVRASSAMTREYTAPAGVSDYAVTEAYLKALKDAGWDVCRTDGSDLNARYTKNGRDIGVSIGSQDFVPRYYFTVVDTGAGLRAALKTNCKAALYGVNFDFNKATLRPDSEPALNQILSVMKDEPKLALEIGGHTDNVGTPAYNLKLSDERAAAVRQWLIGHGIPPSRLTSHGYGDTQPLVPNSSDENRAKNRRVEVKRTDCK